MKVTQRQLEDLSLLYVILNLFEYVLRLNYEFLNDMAKIKFSSVLNGAKWLNKQAEQFIQYINRFEVESHKF